MTDHDPLCKCAEGPCCPWILGCDCQCTCDVISEIREDERRIQAASAPVRKRRMVDGEEWDAYTRWRHLLIYMGRPGVVKKIKRRTHKRERREARNEIREQLEP